MLRPKDIPELRRLQTAYAALAVENADLLVTLEQIVNATTKLKKTLAEFRKQRQTNERQIDQLIAVLTARAKDHDGADPADWWKTGSDA